MQKKILAAAVAALCGFTGTAMAQQAGSKVQLWGIVDAGIRHTNNEGADRGNKTQMIGGGMSQSRWGIKVEEDLGGVTKALVELENRFTTDDGASPVGNTPFFQLANIGLQGSFGKLTLGRQWNVLFDVVTSTYASFPYSPYMEAYKPELGMAMGARASNMLKYTFATPSRNLVGSLQYSFDENNTVDDVGAANVNVSGAVRTVGGFLRYGQSGLAVGAGYMGMKMPGGTKVDAWTLGGSYRSGKLYANVGYGVNKRKGDFGLNANSAVDAGLLNAYWSGQTNGGFVGGNPGIPGLLDFANKREMFKIGFGYQLTEKINAGAHYFHAKQSGSSSGTYNGKADFFVVALDYAFSKRTDAYFGVDHTKVRGGSGMAIESPALTGNVRVTKRTGVTAGIRHRF